jgi:hypothetical protein
VSEAAGHAGQADHEETLVDIEHGNQVLLTTGPMVSTLRSLPDEAFENLLVVTVGDEPAGVERTVADLGHEPGKVGVVPVSATPVSAGGEAWTAPRVSPGDLTGISIGIAQGMRYVRPDEGWFVFDDLGVLFMHAEAARVCQLVSTLAAKCRARDVTGVFGLVPEAVDDAARAQVESLLDQALDGR